MSQSPSENAREEELLPCPFCGGRAHLADITIDDPETDTCSPWFEVGCGDCENVRFQGNPEGCAIEQWNTRAIDSAAAAKDAEIKRLYRLLDLQGAQQWGIDNLASLDAITQERNALKEVTAAKERENQSLREQIENAKSAFGEHPDTDVDLAERISQLRNENRAWFHKYTQNIQ